MGGEAAATKFPLKDCVKDPSNLDSHNLTVFDTASENILSTTRTIGQFSRMISIYKLSRVL